MTALAQTWIDILPKPTTTAELLQERHTCTEEIKEREELDENDVGVRRVWGELEAVIETYKLTSPHTSNTPLFELARRIKGIEKKHRFRCSPPFLLQLFELGDSRINGF